jgi:hypothetical protein
MVIVSEETPLQKVAKWAWDFQSDRPIGVSPWPRIYELNAKIGSIVGISR